MQAFFWWGVRKVAVRWGAGWDLSFSEVPGGNFFILWSVWTVFPKKYRKRHYIASRCSPCWSSTAAAYTIRKSVVLRFFWHPTFVHTTRVGRESSISPSSNWGEIGGVSGIGRYNRPHRRSGACIPFLLWYYVGYIHFSLLIIDNTRNILCYYSLIVWCFYRNGSL